MTTPPRKRANSNLRTNAKQLRRDATYPEQALWYALRSKQLRGLKFRRQHPIDCYVVDFFCGEGGLVVEVDGESHEGQQVADAERQKRLEELGFVVLRVTNDEVLENLDGVLEAILKAAIAGGANPLP
ncbi:hypothetical protein Pla123a_17580 [Posidoniimonas polymericola]|uniref:DUF559 domain-containing protein n=1 Tax=Posidoniimonas polymericola TaxID=2528002 RepID=A0A5C5YSN2_9BACT|nr:DUF559 domain-containing protein [Posidoniimonas polymericola]TWT77959.1 hypothetical protein Pla123a_17580 [Posidoniimonas polymericola]